MYWQERTNDDEETAAAAQWGKENQWIQLIFISRCQQLLGDKWFFLTMQFHRDCLEISFLTDEIIEWIIIPKILGSDLSNVSEIDQGFIDVVSSSFADEHVNVCACVLDIQQKQMNIQRTSVQRGCCSSHQHHYHSKFRLKKGMMPRAHRH